MRFACLLFALTFSAPAQDPLLWGGLKRGPYVTGFQSSIALDHSRKYDRKARPILLECWYPAAESAAEALVYAE